VFHLRAKFCYTGIVACGGPDAGSGLETWDLNAGDEVTVSWDTWPDSHKGPVTEYMAYCGGKKQRRKKKKKGVTFEGLTDFYVLP
jgi:hypothetical protein